MQLEVKCEGQPEQLRFSYPAEGFTNLQDLELANVLSNFSFSTPHMNETLTRSAISTSSHYVSTDGNREQQPILEIRQRRISRLNFRTAPYFIMHAVQCM